MGSNTTRKPAFHAWVIVALSVALVLLASCARAPAESPSGIDLEPFKEQARTADCADITNRIFVIDGQMVFWDVAGNCADGSYSRTLYGTAVDEVLCQVHDSIAGPAGDCQEAHRALFDTITENLDKPDLGLGPEHTVQGIPF
jgi:hypothetical protein